MAEYIERDAICYQLKKQERIDGQPRAIRRARRIVADFPAADVVPVRHGRWFLDGDYEYINCSECLHPFYMGFDTSSDARQYLAREERWKYCPNCGAKMDGSEEVR